MGYEEFKDTLKILVQGKVGEGVEVYFQTTVINNQIPKDVLGFRKEGVDGMPEIILSGLYEIYVQSQKIELVLDRIMEIYQNQKKILTEEYHFMEWEEIKSKIMICLVKKEWNEERLKTRAYKEFLDMAVIFRGIVWNAENMATVDITNDLLEQWGIGIDDLWKAGMENLRNEPIYIRSIAEIMGFEVDEEIPFYIMSRKSGPYGAAAMLREDMLQEFAKELESDLYILPCSVHEIILLEKTDDTDVLKLKRHVQAVNNDSGAVRPEECLSDMVYLYDRKEKCIKIAV